MQLLNKTDQYSAKDYNSMNVKTYSSYKVGDGASTPFQLRPL